MSKILKISNHVNKSASENVGLLTDSEKMFLDLIAKIIVNKISVDEKGGGLREN